MFWPVSCSPVDAPTGGIGLLERGGSSCTLGIAAAAAAASEREDGAGEVREMNPGLLVTCTLGCQHGSQSVRK